MDNDEELELYWRSPTLAAQLPEELRKKINERFFELLKKSKQSSSIIDKEEIPKPSMKTSEYESASIVRCPFHLGYLKNLQKSGPIPDKCFECPNLLQCST
jgi:hypothetical protein